VGSLVFHEIINNRRIQEKDKHERARTREKGWRRKKEVFCLQF
jgi:hypothetical protein